MKQLSILLLFTTLSMGIGAQNQAFFPKKGDKILNQYLLSSLHKQYEARKSSLNIALKSQKALNTYQDKCRLRYMSLFTDLPQNRDSMLPAVDLLYSIACDKYRIEKLILNQEITVNLYVPNIEGAKPAILFFCGHEMSSKSTESYQKTAILLAKHGFVVMVIDPRGQGERIELVDEQGKNLTRGATTEHTLLNMGMGLSGWSMVQIELLENTWCLNYLCTRLDVDKNRIGCIGNSGGGAQASYFSAIEPRIKAVACCSWFTQRERMLTQYGPDDGCQYLWNEGREQLDIPDYYIMQAPRPMLILAGIKDFIDYQGTLNAFKEAKQAYSLLGQANNAELFSYEDGHGISQPKREAAVRFFKKHFMEDSSLVIEGDLKIQTESALTCFGSGQIYAERQNRIDRNVSTNPDNINKRKLFSLTNLDSTQVLVRKLLAIPNDLGTVQAKKVGKSTTNKTYKEQKYILKRDKQPDLPIRVLTPLNPRKKIEVFIVLHDSGMVKSDSLPQVQKILEKGNIVLLADPRGIGETKDNPCYNNKKFYSEDYRNAALSLFLGQPLLGQRVIDIITVVDFIKTKTIFENDSIQAINIFSFGNIGVAAQHAYYLDERIQHTANKDCMSSWEEVIQNPLTKNLMSLMVPSGLKYYDLGMLRRVR